MVHNTEEDSFEEEIDEEEYIKNANNQEERRKVRKVAKENYETIIENKQALCNIHDKVFDNLLEKVKEVSKSTHYIRELQYDIGCVRELSHAIKSQAYTLCDVSTRFNSNDLSYNIKNKFALTNDEIDWTKLGKQAKLLFTSTPVFTVSIRIILLYI